MQTCHFVALPFSPSRGADWHSGLFKTLPTRERFPPNAPSFRFFSAIFNCCLCSAHLAFSASPPAINSWASENLKTLDDSERQLPRHRFATMLCPVVPRFFFLAFGRTSCDFLWSPAVETPGSTFGRGRRVRREIIHLSASLSSIVKDNCLDNCPASILGLSGGQFSMFSWSPWLLPLCHGYCLFG